MAPRSTHARRLGIVMTIAVLSSMFFAAPAAAATPCGNSPAPPWTDGNYAYFANTAYCPEWGPYATMSEARLQEQVLGVWYFRGDPKRTYHSGTTVLGSGTGSYYCNGHDTDNYRTRGGLRDTNDETKYTNGSATSLTC
jgi:hypothetical protein